MLLLALVQGGGVEWVPSFKASHALAADAVHTTPGYQRTVRSDTVGRESSPAPGRSVAASESVPLVSRIGGAIHAVTVNGSYAFIGMGPGLTILDVSNPGEMPVVGRTDSFPSDYVRDVIVSGNYAYVANDTGGLRVVDISDPSDPTEVGAYDTPNQARSVTLAGDYAYVASSTYDSNVGGWDGSLRILDISDPHTPTEVGVYNATTAQSVAVAGNYAYVVTSSSLRVVDISDPTNPSEVGVYNSLSWAEDVAVAGDYAYVGTFGAIDGTLHIVDISNPGTPSAVSTYDLPGDAQSMAVSGGYIYIAHENGDLTVVDVSAAGTPVSPGFYHTSASDATDVAVGGSYAYVSAAGGLKVVDLSQPPLGNAFERGATQLVADNDESVIAVAGGYAYVGQSNWNEHKGSLHIVDISNPSHPIEVGNYDGSYDGGSITTITSIAVAGNYAYLTVKYTAPGCGVAVVDISNPSNPNLVSLKGEVSSFCDSGDNMTVVGNYAYYTDFNGVLWSLDISDPANSTKEDAYYGGGIFGSGLVDDMTIAGGYAYAVVQDSLRVVDISNPTNLTEVGASDPVPYGDTVVVVGEYAYLLGWDVLWVLDISDPTLPAQVNSFNEFDDGIRIWGDGSYIYMSDEKHDLRVLAGTTNLTEVRTYDELSMSHGDVAVAGNYIYTVGGDYNSETQVWDGTLRVLDRTTLNDGATVGAYVPPTTPSQVTVAGSYAYVSSGVPWRWGENTTTGKLWIVDISVPTVPNEASVYEAPHDVLDMALTGDYAYLATGNGGLRVVDVSNPATPTEVSSDGTDAAEAVVATGDYVYVANQFDDLRILDVSDPHSPTEVGIYNGVDEVKDMTVDGNYLYVVDAQSSSSLRIVDISDPRTLIEVGAYLRPENAQNVAVADNYAYVADAHGVLWIVDVSNPSNPTEASFYDLPHAASDVAVSGNYAYVSLGLDEYEDEEGGLVVLDISDPGNPVDVGTYAYAMSAETGGVAEVPGVAVADDYVYLAARKNYRLSWGELLVLQFGSKLSAKVTAAPAFPSTGEQVTFTTHIENAATMAGTAIVTATIPNDSTYVPGSATTTQGSVAGSGPLVFTLGDIPAHGSVELSFAVTINDDVTTPTLITTQQEMTWNGGSHSLARTVIANGMPVYLPITHQ